MIRFLAQAETYFTERSGALLKLAALVLFGVVTYAAVTTPAGDAVLLSLGIAAVSCLLLVLRRSAAVTVWSLSLCALASLVVIRDWSSAVVWTCQLGLVNLVVCRGGWRSVGAGVLTFCGLCVVRAVHEPFPFWSATTMTLAGWTLGAAGAGAGILARAQYVALIEERAQREAEAQEAGARHRSAEERLRIARDLHDALGHNVAVIRLHAGLARRALRTDPDQAEAALRETESAAKSVLQELAGVLRLLRETGQDQQPAPVPGLGDIDAVVAALRAGGMTVTVDREGDPARVSAVAGMTAYRVVQESLTNARRHGAGPVSLSVRVEPECLVVRTANAVPAADRPATSGFGLLGMRERVRAVGGDLDVTATDTSFVVTARIPVAAADGAGAGGMMER